MAVRRFRVRRTAARESCGGRSSPHGGSLERAHAAHDRVSYSKHNRCEPRPHVAACVDRADRSQLFDRTSWIAVLGAHVSSHAVIAPVIAPCDRKTGQPLSGSKDPRRRHADRRSRDRAAAVKKIRAADFCGCWQRAAASIVLRCRTTRCMGSMWMITEAASSSRHAMGACASSGSALVRGPISNVMAARQRSMHASEARRSIAAPGARKNSV
jgi:hypothetical protein